MSKRQFVSKLSLWNKAWMTATTMTALSTSAAANTCAMTVEHMPPIGLGTFLLQRDEVAGAIHSALEAGYRRIDCAPVYFNEDVIGDALAQELANSNSHIKRSDLFIVSKLASPFHRKEHVERALRKTLADLRLTYLDLYLIHWPVAFKYVEIPNQRGWANEDIDDSDGGNNIDPSVSVKETWKAMEDLVEAGLVRSIGVSNFPVALLHEVMAEARIAPTVNQVELHPYLQQSKLLAYCKARGVRVQAYSPLGTPSYKGDGEPDLMNDVTLQRIAARYNATTAQICLAWAIQRGTSVVSKSASPLHQAENIAAASGSSIQLLESEMNDIAALDRGYRFFRPEEWWGAMALAVFD